MRTLIVVWILVVGSPIASASPVLMRSPQGRTISVEEKDAQYWRNQGYHEVSIGQVVAEIEPKATREEIEESEQRASRIWIAVGVIATIMLALVAAAVHTRSKNPRRIMLGGGDARGVRLRAPDGGIVIVPPQSLEFALRDGYQEIPKVNMRSPDGTHVLVDEDQVLTARAQGYWPMTSSEVAAMSNRLQR